MNIIKLTVLFFTLLYQLDCRGQDSCSISRDTFKLLSEEKLSTLITELNGQNFKTSKDKNKIPPYIKQQLICLTKDSFSLANPNEPYRCCCMSPEELPRRQLLFFSKSDNYFVITYLLGGGMGIMTKVEIFKLAGKSIIDSWYYSTPLDFKSVHELLKHLRITRKYLHNRLTRGVINSKSLN